MKLNHGIHLAYCTNVHRGGDWAETFNSLSKDVMRVRARVSPDNAYAIGLRLGADAARELADAGRLLEFQRWLEINNSYVFTINGFPYGQFHGTRVKEQVYRPDWSNPERLEYTNLLFDLLSELLPAGVDGSVSTLPGSFKEFIGPEGVPDAIYDNLESCCRHVENLTKRTGQDLHLGLEPEPLGLFETSGETVEFLDTLGRRLGSDDSWKRIIGVNYDTCHLAVEFEEPAAAFGRILDSGYRISKIHLSSALTVIPTREALEGLADFHEEVYLHQVISARNGEVIHRKKDLDIALQDAAGQSFGGLGEEWRIHFHVPLHASPGPPFGDTRDHVLGTLDILQQNPALCTHLEMETYTWEVLPQELRTNDVVDQVVKEYQWTTRELENRGLADPV
jgi:hypothetical protein